MSEESARGARAERRRGAHPARARRGAGGIGDCSTGVFLHMCVVCSHMYVAEQYVCIFTSQNRRRWRLRRSCVFIYVCSMFKCICRRADGVYVHIYFTEQCLYKCISLSAAQKEKDFVLMQIKGLLDILKSQLATQFLIAHDCRADF